MSQIKEAFTSRFPDGVILEADFSQLEVLGAAVMSGDPLLIEDILSGRDMHRYFASLLFNKPQEAVTKQERTFTKRMTFQLQYGAGAKSMSQKLSIAKKKAEEFIKLYYGRYTVLAEWQANIMEAVKRSRKPSEGRTKRGLPQGRGEWESPTGRVYVFLEQDKPEGWMGEDKEPDFNPPEVKNYPIQGFATGDIMALFRGRVLRRWLNEPFRQDALPINTVHDSVMYDCRNREVAIEVGKMLESVAAELPDVLRETWGLVVPVEFKIEVSIGPAWASTKPL